jgi:hypothetical protein
MSVFEHLHVQSSFLDRHRTHLEGLRPHHAGRSVCYLIDRDRGLIEQNQPSPL